MKKELVKKMLEAGLVDRDTALMFERWKGISSDFVELHGRKDLRQASRDDKVRYAEDLEEDLNEEMEHIRESRLQPRVCPERVRIDSEEWFALRLEENGSFLLPCQARPSIWPGRVFYTSSNESGFMVKNITLLYVDEQPCAYEVDVEPCSND